MATPRAPIRGSAGLLGAAMFTNGPSGRVFSADDTVVAGQLAERFATAIEQRYLHRSVVEFAARTHRLQLLSGALAETILGENERRATERICLDDFRAVFQIFAVNPENYVGARDVQVFVAALEMRAPEIRGRQILLLQHSAHRAIQHEDALAEKFAKGEALLNQILHVANSIFSRVRRQRGVV